MQIGDNSRDKTESADWQKWIKNFENEYSILKSWRSVYVYFDWALTVFFDTMYLLYLIWFLPSLVKKIDKE